MLVPYQRQNFKQDDSLAISKDLQNVFARRRTIRQFSTEKPDEEIVLNAISIAGLSPSGANKQPWSFCLIKNQALKTEMRVLAEKEEHQFYYKNPNKKMVQDLKHLHTNADKAFLTEAPYLIVIFYKNYDHGVDEKVSTNYYAKESTGIATGMLISALHLSGLSTLTYTPTRMQFLGKLLERPKNERPFMVLGVGLPGKDAKVPMLGKKSLQDICKTYL